jgi:hypothetical protein
VKYFTAALTSASVARPLTSDVLDAWAVAVDADEDLAAAACGIDLARRAVDVVACVDVQDEDVARELAIAAFRRAGARAGLGRLDVASIVLTPDGSDPDDERA